MMEPPFMLQGFTPLDMAFFEGNIHMAKRLIENGANIMVGDAMMEPAILMQGFTSLDMAFFEGDIYMAKRLIENGAIIIVRAFSSPNF